MGSATIPLDGTAREAQGVPLDPLVRVARRDCINWVWYVEYQVSVDGTCALVLAHYRLHKWDDLQGSRRHPRNDDLWGHDFTLLEEPKPKMEDPRIVYGLRVERLVADPVRGAGCLKRLPAQEYLVLNPAGPFDYPSGREEVARDDA